MKAAERVATVGRPLAVAVAAQVGSQDVPFAPQSRSHPVPIAAMVPPTMQKHQRECSRISPIDVVEPQALREIDS